MDTPIRILVVDDNAQLRAATVRLVQGAGYVTAEAPDGTAALDLVRAFQPDLLLLDVEMPGINGVEVCRRIKADASHTAPFVVLLSSSRIATEDQSLGLEQGADGYIARPIANRELLARVHSFVRLQQAEHALRESEAKLKVALMEKEKVIAELQTALSEVKTLSGLIPICAGCKSVRDDRGFWNQVETYIARRTDARFTHGLCPKCVAKYLPGLEDGTDSKATEPTGQP